MIEDDHHPSLHVDFGKFLPKLASYVNYLFADIAVFGAGADGAAFRDTLSSDSENNSRLRINSSYGLQLRSFDYCIPISDVASRRRHNNYRYTKNHNKSYQNKYTLINIKNALAPIKLHSSLRSTAIN